MVGDIATPEYAVLTPCRAAQVETLLNDKGMPRQPQPPPPPPSTRYSNTTMLDPVLFGGDPIDKDNDIADMLSASERYFMGQQPPSMQSRHPFEADSPIMDIPMPMPMPMPSNILDDPPLSWELMALGLGEPLPAQEIVDSLYVPYITCARPRGEGGRKIWPVLTDYRY